MEEMSLKRLPDVPPPPPPAPSSFFSRPPAAITPAPVASTSAIPPPPHSPSDSNSSPETDSAGQPPAKKKRVLAPGPPPPPGAIVTDKSCARCRARKVKCDRIFPVCKNCLERHEECDLATILRKDKPTGMSTKEAERFARLEQRLAELEAQVVVHPAAVPPVVPPPPNPPAHSHPIHAASLAALLDSLPDSPPALSVPNIGQQSLDWRLAEPQMARSLSQHLCDAFFESCCFLLPAFTYFRTRLPDYHADPAQLDAQDKISVAVFCAVGARASPHSALLGIAASPDDSRDHPEAPLLSAGTRRENACRGLLHKALALCFQQGVEDDATEENLAALLALMQMAIFVELSPKKSRSLLRSALSHFKDLQDVARTTEEKTRLKRCFALAIYHGDSLTSSSSRKACLISDDDLRRYFDHVGIVVPNLPEMDLTPILANLFGTREKPLHEVLRTATHLLLCWTCACQRMFVRIVTPSGREPEELALAITALFSAIDSTRAAIQYLETIIFESGTELSPHSLEIAPAASAHGHIHESDYLSQAIRLDRDLLDLFSMVMVMLEKLPGVGLPGLLGDAKGRVRKGLKTQAFYCKIYLTGVDAHMIYHHTFQLEHNPNWTQMALQRLGDPNGPRDETEVVSDVELSWFIEGLRHACFYTPAAEARLAELAPRLQEIEPPIEFPSPLPEPSASPYTGNIGDLPPMTPGAAAGGFSFDSIFAGLDNGAGTGTGEDATVYDYDQFAAFLSMGALGGEGSGGGEELMT